ncbi:hypothetical protein J437_LFUL004898, partial [Ladona fulva]
YPRRTVSNPEFTVCIPTAATLKRRLRRRRSTSSELTLGDPEEPTEGLIVRRTRSGRIYGTSEKAPADTPVAPSAASSIAHLQQARDISRTEEIVCSLYVRQKGISYVHERKGRIQGKVHVLFLPYGTSVPCWTYPCLLRMGNYTEHVGALAPVFLATVMEYLATEFLELAGNTTSDNKKATIIPHSTCYLQG